MQKPRTKADRLAALTAGLDMTTELPSAAPVAPAADVMPPLPPPAAPKTPNPAVNLRMPTELLSRYVTAAAIRSQAIGRNVTPQTIMLEVLIAADLDAVNSGRGNANG